MYRYNLEIFNGFSHEYHLLEHYLDLIAACISLGSPDEWLPLMSQVYNSEGLRALLHGTRFESADFSLPRHLPLFEVDADDLPQVLQNMAFHLSMQAPGTFSLTIDRIYMQLIRESREIKKRLHYLDWYCRHLNRQKMFDREREYLGIMEYYSNDPDIQLRIAWNRAKSRLH